MSQQTVSTYNPEAIQLIIDGVPIEGLSEDGITIEQSAESEIVEGMDSGMTYNYEPSRMATVTVSLRAASTGARRLNAVRQVVESVLRSGNGHPSISGVVRDPVNGSIISSSEVFFLNKPMPDFAKQAGNVEFTLAFCNYDNQVAILVAN